MHMCGSAQRRHDHGNTYRGATSSTLSPAFCAVRMYLAAGANMHPQVISSRWSIKFSMSGSSRNVPPCMPLCSKHGDKASGGYERGPISLV